MDLDHEELFTVHDQRALLISAPHDGSVWIVHGDGFNAGGGKSAHLTGTIGIRFTLVRLSEHGVAQEGAVNTAAWVW